MCLCACSRYQQSLLLCQCVAVCCSVLQCVAVCCSVLACVHVCMSKMPAVTSVVSKNRYNLSNQLVSSLLD